MPRGTSPPGVAEGWHAVGPLDAFAEGKPTEGSAGGAMLVVVRWGDAAYAADLHCPHKFGNLADGAVDGMQITCPMHTATFDLATGRPRAGEEWAGTLRTYPTRVREGVLEVHLGAA